MELFGFDVGMFGNYEFDEGIVEFYCMIEGGDYLKGIKGYNGMNFLVVVVNVYDMLIDKLIIEFYVIKEVGGKKIGFIGVVI